jgi:lipopolysaccharide transport system permease protein
VKNETWTIKHQKSIYEVKLLEIWAYRYLLLLLINKDIISFYKQTILGPIWLFVQPLLTTLTFTLVFGKVASLSTDGLSQPLFYLAGITIWNYFSECFNKTANVLKDNASIFGKVYFPRLIVPLSIGLSNLVKFIIQFFLLIGCVVIYYFKGTDFNMSEVALLLPLLLLLVGLQGLGMGMIVAALTTKYKDLLFLVGFGLQLLMYSTTVIYPLSSTPENLRWVIQINPMTAVMEAFRQGFLGKGTFSPVTLSYSFLVSIVVFVLGILLYNRAEKNFIDTI